VPAIRRLVKQVTPENSTAVKRYETVRKSIENCLRVGVVPYSRDSDVLDPVSIINSAFGFYLTSLPDVIKRFEGAKGDDVAVHSLWTKRLEMWTMKAIEDSQIQDRLRRVKGTAIWSSLARKS